MLGVTAVVAAGCTGRYEDNDPPAPPSSPGASLLHDDIAQGIVAQDRGFATFPVSGKAGRRIVGAAAVLRNTTGQPLFLLPADIKPQNVTMYVWR